VKVVEAKMKITHYRKMTFKAHSKIAFHHYTV